MKLTSLASLLLTSIAVVSVTAVARCADISKIPWTDSNIETLRTFDKAAIMQFADSNGETGTDILKFSWIDLAGNGCYALVLHGSPGAGRLVMVIYQQDDAGKITAQQIDGDGLLKDVNGDDKQELLLPPPLPHPDWQSFGAVTQVFCPHVYRLENGKYIEASRDFPNYYDSEVLPPIENAISDARFRLAHGPIGKKPEERWVQYMRHKIAGLMMERDQILRMIGRDPKAGLEQARDWMNSPDAALVQDAITVFKNIGGHESDVCAAADKLKEEHCDMNGFGPSALRGDKTQSDWLVYTNPKNSLSFRYPPSMRVEERDPATFHMDYPPQVIVDVVGHSVGPDAILRFMCAPGVKTPEMAAATLRRYSQQTHSSEEERPCTSMEIDGHEAFVGGPFNGPWTVNILQPRDCEIFPMAGNDDAQPPHDGKFPLLSIIQTAHFEPTAM